MNKKTNHNLPGAAPPEQQQLLDYLEGRMPRDEAEAMERRIDNDPFLQDALDGLRPIADKKQLAGVVSRMNRKLKRQLAPRRGKRRVAGQKLLLWVAAVVILLLALLSWWVVHLLQMGG